MFNMKNCRASVPTMPPLLIYHLLPRLSLCTAGSKNVTVNTKQTIHGSIREDGWMYGDTYSKGMAQPGKVANPARGQLKGGKIYFPVSALFVPENLVSRDGFGSPVPRQPAHLHTQTEYGTYIRDSSRVPRRRPFIYFKPPHDIGLVPSLSGHAIAYR